MTDDEDNQQDLFPLDPSWFHVFRQMIDNGDAAKMGGTTFLIYCVIKAHVNFTTGASFPQMSTIAKKSGSSERTCHRQIEILEQMGYVSKTRKPGSKVNLYKLVEKFNFEIDGREPGTKEEINAAFDYVPRGIAKAVHELRQVEITGKDPANSSIRIDRMVINLQVNKEAGNNTQFVLNDVKDPELREMLRRSLERTQSKTPPDDD
jgi:DNA-binding transcriptional MocR family regulator